MRDWVLHHLHFMIVADALIHVIIMLLSIAAIVTMCFLIKAVKSHPNANRTSTTLAYIMLGISGFMNYSAVRAFISCAAQYHTWWNK
jgi:hypothetical protein